MKKDVDWTLEQLVTYQQPGPEASDQEEALKWQQARERARMAAKRWLAYISEGKWQIVVDAFWTYPHSFHRMKEVDSVLYQELSKSDLIIFKGDLNYRKLVGDLAWPSQTDFSRALLGFHPAPIVALRTVKADVATGLSEGQEQKLAEEDPKWMVNGEWALVQICDRRE